MAMPAVRAKTAISRYWDRRAPVYDQEPAAQRHLAVWQQIFATALPEPPRRLLDIGTGTGFNARLLASLGHDVVGLDRSSGMLRQARSNAVEQQLALDLVRGDAEDVPFGTARLDGIVTRNVLWTLPNPLAALTQWHRALHPGGVVVIADGVWQPSGVWAAVRRWIERFQGVSTQGTSVFHFPLVYGPLRERLPLVKGISGAQIEHMLTQTGFGELVRWEDRFPDNPYTAAAHQGFFVISAHKTAR